jgi:hypothetical protein
MINRFEKLNKIWVVVFLFLLIWNDFYLKFALNNWFTGKLSDFAGLFVFPYFFACVFETKEKLVYWTTAIGFVFWKSAFSTPFISLWNAHFFQIYRVIDGSDLFALLMLPISYQYFTNQNTSRIRLYPTMLVVLSLFSFIATFQLPRKSVQFLNVDKTYEFNFSKNELKIRLSKNYSYNKSQIHILFSKYFISNADIDAQQFDGNKKNFEAFEYQIQNAVKDTLNLDFIGRGGKHISTTFLVTGDSLNSKLRLIIINARVLISEENKQDKYYFLKEIENKFIKKLNRN